MADLGGIALPLVRGLILATLLLLAGTASAGLLVDRAGIRRDTRSAAVIEGWLLRLPGLLAWFLLTLSLLRGALQVLAFTDPGASVDPELAKAVLSTGSWGAGWIAQTILAFLVLALSWLLRNARLRLRATVIVASVGLWLAQAGMGHGVDPFWTPLVAGRLVHFGHLLGGALWLGTLGVLALAVFPSLTGHDDRTALLAILRDFSVLARAGALVIVASGVVASWTYLTTIADLWQSDWGRLLLAKVLTFGGIATVGLWNWRVVTPRLVIEHGASRALRRAVLLELSLAGVLLAITAVLVGTGTPAE